MKLYTLFLIKRRGVCCCWHDKSFIRHLYERGGCSPKDGTTSSLILSCL